MAFDLGEHGEELVASEESHDLFRVTERVIQHALEQVFELQGQLLEVDAGEVVVSGDLLVAVAGGERVLETVEAFATYVAQFLLHVVGVAGDASMA